MIITIEILIPQVDKVLQWSDQFLLMIRRPLIISAVFCYLCYVTLQNIIPECQSIFTHFCTSLFKVLVFVQALNDELKLKDSPNTLWTITFTNLAKQPVMFWRSRSYTIVLETFTKNPRTFLAAEEIFTLQTC